MKKILVITSIVLTLFLLALVGYYFINQTNNPEQGAGSNVFKSFFPFGGNDGPGTEVASTTENTENTIEQPVKNPVFGQKLRKISSEEVSGAGSNDFKAGTVVRYIEKATGHIYEVELFSPKVARISNTTIPVVYDAIWNSANDSLITRYVQENDQTIDTYSLTVKNLSTSTENTIAGTALPRNITDISAVGNSMFYLVRDTTSSSGYVANFDGSKSKRIWNSDLKELTSQYVNTRTVALTTKPARNINGYLYFVDTTNGSVSKILGQIAGLSTLTSPDGSKVLYISQTDRTQMYVYDTKTKVSTSITPVTLPEKCVWSTINKNVVYCAVSDGAVNADSQTQWYKGLLSFNDDIWKYDMTNNTASMLTALSEDSGTSIDVIKPILSANEKYLIFVNKIDNSLWSLDLVQATNPVTQP